MVLNSLWLSSDAGHGAGISWDDELFDLVKLFLRDSFEAVDQMIMTYGETPPLVLRSHRM